MIAQFIFHKSIFPLVLVILAINGVIWRLASLSNASPLVIRYTILGGIEEVGDGRVFTGLPFFSFLLFAINFSVAFFYFYRDKTIAYIFLGSGIIIQIMFLFSILAFRAVNGY